LWKKFILSTCITDQPFEAAGKLLLEIGFDGSSFSGWQIQPHCLAVQQVVQEKLSKLFAGLPIRLEGSSRTDAGVHACALAASFAIPGRPYIPVEQLQKALNRQLPHTIRIRSIAAVPTTFNARFNAVGKAYTYIINTGAESPFDGRYSWHTRRRFNPEKVAAAIPHLVGMHDFSAFVVERSQIDDAVRTIYRIEMQQFDRYYTLTFVGNSFLYKMIRCLVGTLEAVAAEKITPVAVRDILASKQRVNAPETAPPHGLFLMKVFYEQALVEQFQLTNLPFLSFSE
jgi:tRNA pseudouridine38-40 synthase